MHVCMYVCMYVHVSIYNMYSVHVCIFVYYSTSLLHVEQIQNYWVWLEGEHSKYEEKQIDSLVIQTFNCIVYILFCTAVFM